MIHLRGVSEMLSNMFPAEKGKTKNFVRMPLPFAYSFKLFPVLEKLDLRQKASFTTDVINEFVNFRPLYFVRKKPIPDNLKNCYVIIYDEAEAFYFDNSGKLETLQIPKNKFNE